MVPTRRRAPLPAGEHLEAVAEGEHSEAADDQLYPPLPDRSSSSSTPALSDGSMGDDTSSSKAVMPLFTYEEVPAYKQEAQARMERHSGNGTWSVFRYSVLW